LRNSDRSASHEETAPGKFPLSSTKGKKGGGEDPTWLAEGGEHLWEGRVILLRVKDAPEVVKKGNRLMGRGLSNGHRGGTARGWEANIFRDVQ